MLVFIFYMFVLESVCNYFQSYVTCAIGIWMVGWTSICGAVLDAATSFVSGQAVRKTGRIPIFTLGTEPNLIFGFNRIENRIGINASIRLDCVKEYK